MSNIMNPGLANLFAYLMLVGWFPLAWVLFATMRPAVATAVTVLGSAMFQPELLALDAPVVPPFDKTVIGSLAAFTGALWVCPERFVRARVYRGIDLAFVALLLGTVGTILTNTDTIVYGGGTVLPGQTAYDGLSAIVRDHLNVFVPFLLGRAIFQKPQDLLDFMKVFAVAGVVYSVLCLFEIRMSPQLHFWAYGYFQHDFSQTIRGGGYRPTVFMSHGISVARFMFGTIIAAATLRRARIRILRTRGGWLLFYLLIVLLLCKSTGAIVFAAICVPLVLFTSPKIQVRAAFILAMMVITFPILRATDIFPTDTLVEWALEISDERAMSLGGRFDQEDQLLDRARERVLFGWGGYGRPRVYDEETGEDISVTDGEWIIVLGSRGAVGFVAWYMLYLAPIFMFWYRFDQIRGDKLKRLAAGAALFITVFVVDTLPNSSGSFPQFFVSGALMGLTAGGLWAKPEGRRVRRRRRVTQSRPRPPTRNTPALSSSTEQS